MTSEGGARALFVLLAPTFRKATERITNYYKARGLQTKCGFANCLWFPNDPGLGIDFVPPQVRGDLEALIRGAGINLKKSDGERGDGAYFIFLKDGLTPQKLDILADAVEQETIRLQGPSVEPPTSSIAL